MLVLLAAGCGLSSGDAREEVAIPPAPAGPSTDLGLGPGVRPLSFGPGDKGSPRINPSGDRIAFVLDGYVTEKALYTQEDSHLRTAKDFGATGTEWLLDESLAVLSQENQGTRVTPTSNTLFTTSAEDSSSEGEPSVSKLDEKVGAVGAVPGGQAVIVATWDEPKSPEKPPRSRLMLLWGAEESSKVYLDGRIEGYVTGLSISPDRRRVALAVRRGTGDAEVQSQGQFEVQIYRLSEGRARRVARVPEGMEVLGAPQWTPRGVYFVAGKVVDSAETTRAQDPTPYALYRATEGSETPEPARDVGEEFVPASIGVSPDGTRLAMVGRRNPVSPTNLYVLDLASDTVKAATTNENMEIKTNPRDLAWAPDSRSVVLVARAASSGPEVYDVPAEALSSAFYNLYEVSVGEPPGGGSEE